MIVLIACICMGSSISFSKGLSDKEVKQNYIEVIILEKGVKRKILIPKTGKMLKALSPYTSQKLTIKKGLQIVFTQRPSKDTIREFEAKYDLKLTQTLRIGYYIFENISSYSDIALIAHIMEEETNIRTIKPDWEKKNLPR